MNGIIFYAGRLIMANPTFAREALMMVVARGIPLFYKDGIKKPHRVRRTVWDHRLWFIVRGLD